MVAVTSMSFQVADSDLTVSVTRDCVMTCMTKYRAIKNERGVKYSSVAFLCYDTSSTFQFSRQSR